MRIAPPRVVIAAPASGHGKTTVAAGLMAALRRAGHRVSGHKVGPDYIDPGYHALATGRPGRNLDAHLVGEQGIVPLFLHGAHAPEPADIAVVEGVMGLYDGALGRDGFASTAHIAALLAAPVILVVDISAASRTIGAVVAGLAGFDPAITVAGVILNKAGTGRHAAEVTTALATIGVPVLGVLRRDDGISAPARHLGLVPVAERPEAAAALDRLAGRIAAGVDLAAVVRIARGAAPLAGDPWGPAEAALPQGRRPVVAVAGGRAFTFRYTETDEILRAHGLEPVVFDPTTDEALPADTAGIYLGGGFPEMHAGELSGNRPLRRHLLQAIDSGVPVSAECAGLLYLCRSLDGAPMVGALAAEARMTDRLSLGYRLARSPAETLLAAAGDTVTGHEFHRTVVNPAAGVNPAWTWNDRVEGFAGSGSGSRRLHASYLHVHWAGTPAVATRFAAAVHAARPVPPSAAGSRRLVAAGVDLHHHGDRDIADGLVDLAVNVRLTAPPGWLADRLRDEVGRLAGYPRTEAARAALAARHGLPPESVLPTAGGAEAFTLIARGLAPSRAVVVHPQFTEPEAALRAAGRPVRRAVLRAQDGFRLRVELVPDDADLVMIGNPTNPTGVLHPADAIRSLCRPGRVVVVDEAFMDAVPGESQSLAGERLPGLLVVRSLTKTWGIAGLRAGYVTGEAALVAALAAVQPAWSVSSLAAAAMVACSGPAAVAEAAEAAIEIEGMRAHLVDGLAGLGLPVVARSAPFVLVDTAALLRPGDEPDRIRFALRDSGFAVRRGDTFPGLGPSWVRFAVRDSGTSDRLLHALAEILPAPGPERFGSAAGDEAGSATADDGPPPALSGAGERKGSEWTD